jgi:phosphoglycolate phosphatase-like HAD superfamily hydrolase
VAKLGAILFDCDGILAETERDGHRVALNMAMKEKNLKVGNQDMKCDEKVGWLLCFHNIVLFRRE